MNKLQPINLDSVDKLVLAIQNARQPIEQKEERKDFYYEKIISSFNKSLLEIKIPTTPMIIYGNTGTGKTLLLRYFQEILSDKSEFIYEPELISEMNKFDFDLDKYKLYRQYILYDEAFDFHSIQSLTDNGKKNYLAFFEKLIYRKSRPIIILTTNHLGFKFESEKIQRRWKDLLVFDNKIKSLELKKNV
jgi:hypothetical protein